MDPAPRLVTNEFAFHVARFFEHRFQNPHSFEARHPWSDGRERYTLLRKLCSSAVGLRCMTTLRSFDLSEGISRNDTHAIKIFGPNIPFESRKAFQTLGERHTPSSGIYLTGRGVCVGWYCTCGRYELKNMLNNAFGSETPESQDLPLAIRLGADIYSRVQMDSITSQRLRFFEVSPSELSKRFEQATQRFETFK